MSNNSKRTRCETVKWTNDREDGNWFNFPLDCFLVEDQETMETKLVMFCAKESDLWSKTHYGFTHDSAHAYLGCELKPQWQVEVGFSIDSFRGQFDQGGILARLDGENWIKAGVEFVDEELLLSCVVARNGISDWSSAAWPEEWKGKTNVVVVRIQYLGDALIVHICLEGEKWCQLRLCGAFGENALRCGPYSCAPTREGLYCEFNRYTLGKIV